MSDPMTNAEVEDVLSSIRRLVSDDKHVIAEAAPASRDRLVLTPALRVTEPDDPQQNGDEDHASENHASEDHASEDHAFQEDTFEDEASKDVQFTHRDAATDASDDTSEPLLLVEDVSDEHSADDAQTEHASNSYTDEPWHEAESDAADTDMAEAESETVEDAEDAQWSDPDSDDAKCSDPDSNDAHADAAEPKQVEAEIDIKDIAAILSAANTTDHMPDEVDTDATPALEEDAHAAQEPAPAPRITDVAEQSLSAKVAALETLLAGQANSWEPDEGDVAPQSSEPVAEALAWEDAMPEETGAFAPDADIEAGPQSDADVEESGFFAGDDSIAPEDIIDEDALRDLISDIVRQELQGALGERITRNVRKLVRREIHRALAANELD